MATIRYGWAKPLNDAIRGDEERVWAVYEPQHGSWCGWEDGRPRGGLSQAPTPMTRVEAQQLVDVGGWVADPVVVRHPTHPESKPSNVVMRSDMVNFAKRMGCTDEEANSLGDGMVAGVKQMHDMAKAIAAHMPGATVEGSTITVTHPVPGARPFKVGDRVRVVVAGPHKDKPATVESVEPYEFINHKGEPIKYNGRALPDGDSVQVWFKNSDIEHLDAPQAAATEIDFETIKPLSPVEPAPLHPVDQAITERLDALATKFYDIKRVDVFRFTGGPPEPTPLERFDRDRPLGDLCIEHEERWVCDRCRKDVHVGDPYCQWGDVDANGKVDAWCLPCSVEEERRLDRVREGLAKEQAFREAAGK